MENKTETPPATPNGINNNIPALAAGQNSEAEAVAAAPTSVESESLTAHGSDRIVDAILGEHNTPAKSEVVWVNPKALRIHPFNSTIYGDDLTESLAMSVKEAGVGTPVMVTRKTRTVASGSTRVRAADAAGLETVPVIFIDEPASDDEFEELIVRFNMGRIKSNETLAREFQHALEREMAAEAAAKRAKKVRGTDPVVKLEPGKSRDRAAVRVGIGASSLEKGLKVVQAIDRLLAEEKTDEAQVLRKTLNHDGFDPAYQRGLREGWIAKPKAKKRKDPKVQTPESEGDAAANPPVQAEAPEVQEVQGPQAPQQVVADADVDNSVDAHIEALRRLKVFVRSGGTEGLGQETKGMLGDAFDEVRKALEEAGVILEMVLA